MGNRPSKEAPPHSSSPPYGTCNNFVLSPPLLRGSISGRELKEHLRLTCLLVVLPIFSLAVVSSVNAGTTWFAACLPARLPAWMRFAQWQIPDAPGLHRLWYLGAAQPCLLLASRILPQCYTLHKWTGREQDA